MELDSALQRLAQDPAAAVDVAEVALRLACDEYPGLDVEAYLGELDGMAREARHYVRGDLDAQVNGLCRYLFHEMGFRGNTTQYYDPRNSYLNQVLDRRTGIPLTLSLVAMAVGNRVGLPVVGVGLPGHFVAKAVRDGQEAIFDPFHGGRRLSPEECEQLVEQVTQQPFHAGAEHMQAAAAGRIIQRLLANLKSIYLRDEDYVRAIRAIERLRQLAPDDLSLRCELGSTFLEAGQPGRAVDELKACLASSPGEADAVTVRKLLDRANGEIARWN
jgi:regulator of sirC expression with transglutaminase-like and TPR domain